MLDRVPPNDIDAERAVLGSMLSDKAAIPVAIMVLGEDPEHSGFYREGHLKVYEAVLSLFKSGTAVDLITVTTALEKTGELEKVGGVSYLDEMIESVPAPENVEYYALRVKEVAQRRIMGRTFMQAADELYDPTGARELEEIVSSVMACVFSSAMGQQDKPKQLIDELNAITDMLKDGMDIGMSTGFVDLDEMSCGFFDSELYILAGRPGIGKTALAIKIIMHISRAGNCPLFLSLEMPRQRVIMRMLSIQAGIPFRKFKKPSTFTSADWKPLSDAIEDLSEFDFTIDDTPGLSISQVVAKVHSYVQSSNVNIVFIDHMHLMHIGSKDPLAAYGEISCTLKSLARELEIPVVCLAQLSRSSERRKDTRPKLIDLRASGTIEQDADSVWCLYRKGYGQEKPPPVETAEVIIRKNRGLETGTVPLRFVGAYMNFEDCDEEEVIAWRKGF